MRIALLGCGTVGGGLVRLLQRNGAAYAHKLGAPLELAAVADRSLKPDPALGLTAKLITRDSHAVVVRPDIDIVVDEIFESEFKDDPKGTRERASEAIERALTESEGLVRITDGRGESHIMSAKFMSAYDGFSFPEVEPRLFSPTALLSRCRIAPTTANREPSGL